MDDSDTAAPTARWFHERFMRCIGPAVKIPRELPGGAGNSPTGDSGYEQDTTGERGSWKPMLFNRPTKDCGPLQLTRAHSIVVSSMGDELTPLAPLAVFLS
ncbi:MAG: hypothetical protein Nkreftii_001466 [Candidatus Nitrospira kreftii]|uniref:Uncharacterized protein n=1 Tax=Candidatus Nitrospira kreftii TaxID=2652173 RepID=A0A7S8IY55_9BACT|nr:MAG: hypothetical protein Nkreftii_001466 [Candidatus Nitrospira kreftii]